MIYKLIGESEEYDNYFVLEKKIEDKRYSFFLSLIQHRFGGWKHGVVKRIFILQFRATFRFGRNHF